MCKLLVWTRSLSDYSASWYWQGLTCISKDLRGKLNSKMLTGRFCYQWCEPHTALEFTKSEEFLSNFKRSDHIEQAHQKRACTFVRSCLDDKVIVPFRNYFQLIERSIRTRNSPKIIYLPANDQNRVRQNKFLIHQWERVQYALPWSSWNSNDWFSYLFKATLWLKCVETFIVKIDKFFYIAFL